MRHNWLLVTTTEDKLGGKTHSAHILARLSVESFSPQAAQFFTRYVECGKLICDQVFVIQFQFPPVSVGNVDVDIDTSLWTTPLWPIYRSPQSWSTAVASLFGIGE